MKDPPDRYCFVRRGFCDLMETFSFSGYIATSFLSCINALRKDRIGVFGIGRWRRAAFGLFLYRPVTSQRVRGRVGQVYLIRVALSLPLTPLSYHHPACESSLDLTVLLQPLVLCFHYGK